MEGLQLPLLPTKTEIDQDVTDYSNWKNGFKQIITDIPSDIHNISNIEKSDSPKGYPIFRLWQK
jgi:hypothetical protein